MTIQGIQFSDDSIERVEFLKFSSLNRECVEYLGVATLAQAAAYGILVSAGLGRGRRVLTQRRGVEGFKSARR